MISLSIFFVVFVYILILAIFVLRNLFKSSIFIWFIGLTIGLVAPYLYSAFGGSDYRVYSDNAFDVYSIIVISYLLIFLFVSVLFLGFFKKNIMWTGKDTDNRFYSLVFSVVAVTVTFYAVFYWDSLPLFALFRGEQFTRPDVYSSNLSFFFSFYTLVVVFLPVMYASSFSSRSRVSIFLFVFVFVFLVIGGNKGILFFFLIFLYLYCSNLSSKLMVMFGFLVLLFLYVVFMLGLSGFSVSNVGYIIESPLKRFFIVQGMGVPARIELVLQGSINAGMSGSDISKEVYQFVYGAPGAMPTFFIGDLFVYFGVFGCLLIGMLVTVLFFFFSVIVDKSASYLKLWFFFILSYSVLMSGFAFETVVRALAIGVFLLFVWFMKGVSRNYRIYG